MDANVDGKRPREEEVAIGPPKVRFRPETEIIAPTAASTILQSTGRITLRFICPGGDIYETTPTYSHQLFENEELHVTPTSSPTIIVTINATNMAHQVEVLGTVTAAEEEEILSCIDPAIPQEVDVLSVGGTTLGEFQSGSEEFEIRRVTHKNQGACELLSACEKLAMWFIETADSVDFKDDKWEALFVFKKAPAGQQPDLVGYTTLYTFLNPVLGAKLRICQALILPKYQKRGIGRELISAVYRECKVRPNVVEVTVEDPAPGFQRLRDVTDTEWYLKHSAAEESNLNGYDKHSKQVTEDIFSVDSSYCARAAHGLKITKAQVELVVDVLQYLLVTTHQNKIGDKDISGSSIPDLKRWRLGQKRKLLKKYPELKNLEKSEMQEELETLYQKHLERITHVCHSGYIRSFFD